MFSLTHISSFLLFSNFLFVEKFGVLSKEKQQNFYEIGCFDIAWVSLKSYLKSTSNNLRVVSYGKLGKGKVIVCNSLNSI